MGESLLLTLPEIILSVAALALLMVAALPRQGSRLCTWLAILAFAVAALFIPGVFGGGAGRVRRPLYRRQLRRLLEDPDLCRRRGGADRCDRLVPPRRAVPRRISGADPLVRGRHGHDGIGRRSAHALHRPSSCRASPPMCSPPSSAATPVPPKPALKYFVLGAHRLGHPALRHFPALRHHRHHLIRRHRRRARHRRHLQRRIVRHGVRACRPRLQDQRGAVPHVDPGRLRRRAVAGHRLLRQRAQGRGVGLAGPHRGRGDGVRPPSNGARSSSSWPWPRPSSVASPRSVSPTSSGCWPIRRSITSASP